MGIPVVYFRSSSFNAHRACEMSAYIEYTLGIRGNSGKAADKGTISHKMLEICAVAKKGKQDGLSVITDPNIGEVLTDNYDPEYLSTIMSRVYNYYTPKMAYHEWLPKDFKDCCNSVWKAIQYKDGMFDPRNRNVVAAEPHFDFEIDKDWAEYNYEGFGLAGKLALKGTIDLVTDIGDGIYEIIDYKCGRLRKDWATGELKTVDNIHKDPQLRIYHYAAKHLYPHVHTFLITIYFINAGGPLTVHLDDSDLEKTEEMLRKRYEIMKNTEEPKILKNERPQDKWKCYRLCHAGKTTFEDTDNVQEKTEDRYGQFTRKGETMCKCEQVRYAIKKKGIDWVTENYKDPSFEFSIYSAPGEVD